MQRNPAYVPTTPNQPLVSYSSLGPLDTPSGHAPAQGGEERVYHVLEQPQRDGEEEEEGVYHMPEEGKEEEGQGMAYEVPIQTKIKRRDESPGKAVEKAYSTPHHN